MTHSMKIRSRADEVIRTASRSLATRGGWHYKWLLTFRFEQSLDGELHVWVQEGKNRPQHFVSDVPCSDYDKVTINNGIAHFAPKGYAIYKLDSIRDIVGQLSGGHQPPTSAQYESGWMSAIVAFSSENSHRYPLFSHRDYSAIAELGPRRMAALHSTVGGVAMTNDGWQLPDDDFHEWFDSYTETSQARCESNLALDSKRVSLASYAQPAFKFGLMQSVVTLGHSKANMLEAEMHLAELSIDPHVGTMD